MTAFKFSKPRGWPADIEVVPATTDLLREFYGRPQLNTVRAMVFVRDGKLIGVAGLKTELGRQVLFSETKPDAGISAQAKWRCARMVVDIAKQQGKPIYTVIEVGDFRSQKWIRMLGFELVAASSEGEVYRWE